MYIPEEKPVITFYKANDSSSVRHKEYWIGLVRHPTLLPCPPSVLSPLPSPSVLPESIVEGIIED